MCLLYWPFLQGAISSYFSKLLGKYISFKTKAQKSCIEGMLRLHFCCPLDCWTNSDTSGMRPQIPPSPLSAPAQARARAHQESCRTEDVTSAGEDRLTPM